MASTVKLTHSNGRVVVVSEEMASHYAANGWTEQKEETKEAPVAKRKSTRRTAATRKNTESVADNSSN